MDLRKLVGSNYDTSAPMEGVIHSMQAHDGPSLRRTNTDVGRPPSSSSRTRAPAPSSSRSFWSTVLDRPQQHAASSSSSSAATSGGASSSSSIARTSGGSTRTSIATMSFRLSAAPPSAMPMRANSTASPYPMRAPTFHTSSGNRTPRSSEHGGASYVCPTCNKQYSTMALMHAHSRKHHHREGGGSSSSANKYQCPSCSHEFSQRSHLNQHLKTVHAGIRPHRCPVPECDKAFGKRSDLKSHVSSVHQHERPFECDLCGKRFAKKSNLSRHREKLHREKLDSGGRR